MLVRRVREDDIDAVVADVGRIVGAGSLADYWTPQAARYTVSQMHVDPASRWRGIGGRLPAHLMSCAREAGPATLHVPSSRNAVGSYRHCGSTENRLQPDAAAEITWLSLPVRASRTGAAGKEGVEGVRAAAHGRRPPAPDGE